MQKSSNTTNRIQPPLLTRLRIIGGPTWLQYGQVIGIAASLCVPSRHWFQIARTIPHPGWVTQAPLRSLIDTPGEIGTMDAFRQSAAMTEGRRLQLFWIVFVLGLFAACGFVACGVGILFTMPIAACAFASIYEKLRPIDEVPVAEDAEPEPAV